MYQHLIVFFASFVISSLLIPVAIKLSQRLDFMDKPTVRKKHDKETPLMGGIVMFITFWTVFFVFAGIPEPRFLMIFAGSILILTIGIYDDWYKSKGKDLPAWVKFIVQIAACSIVCLSGITFTGFTNPFGGAIVVLPMGLQYILTVLWIFGITTVINFMDGMDGLAGGIVTISAMSLFFLAVNRSQAFVAIMTIAIVGIGLSYLRYNRPPAKLFMGDSGATFLGYMLAVVSLEGVLKQATLVSVFVPVLIFGVPIFDNIYVVLKRLANKKPVYMADRTQLHYRLLDKGYKPEQVNRLVYSVTASLSVVAVAIFVVMSNI